MELGQEGDEIWGWDRRKMRGMQLEEKGEGRDRVVGVGRWEELVKRINRNCIARN